MPFNYQHTKTTRKKILAFLEWLFLRPTTRKILSTKGIWTARDFIDVRVSIHLENKDSFTEWVYDFGFGLVKDPTDVYTLMRKRLEDEPDFAFVPNRVASATLSRAGVGFRTSKLASGAWFYSCPFQKESEQATIWLYQTSEVMGFVPSWRQNA